MTLRDVGDWFSEKWQAILDGFHIAWTQSFWDWPLWLSIPVGIGVPILVLWWLGALAKELREGEPEPLGWTIAFGVLAFLSALTTYDLWVSMTIWGEGDENLDWLRIGYPIMTTFFGSYFFVSVAKRRRASGQQRDDDQ